MITHMTFAPDAEIDLYPVGPDSFTIAIADDRRRLEICYLPREQVQRMIGKLQTKLCHAERWHPDKAS